MDPRNLTYLKKKRNFELNNMVAAFIIRHLRSCRATNPAQATWAWARASGREPVSRQRVTTVLNRLAGDGVLTCSSDGSDFRYTINKVPVDTDKLLSPAPKPPEPLKAEQQRQAARIATLAKGHVLVEPKPNPPPSGQDAMAFLRAVHPEFAATYAPKDPEPATPALIPEIDPFA